MKIVRIGFYLFLLNFLLGSCDGDPGPSPAELLLGTWENTSYVATGCVDDDDNENETCTNHCEIIVIKATKLTIVGEDQFFYNTNGSSLNINLGGGPEVLEFSVTDTELIFNHQATPDRGGCKSMRTYKRYDNTVTDADGNEYNTIFIGEQEWMKENLRTTRYSNGAEIPNVTEASAWVTAFQGAYANYDNSESNAEKYGRLYNFHAANDPRNICPIGWHVPETDEWNVLFATLGGENIAGGKMKSSSDLWLPLNEGATNESDFTALPGGTRFDAGEFIDLRGGAHFRSSDGATFWVQNGSLGVELFYNLETNGSSVRCVKNQ